MLTNKRGISDKYEKKQVMAVFVMTAGYMSWCHDSRILAHKNVQATDTQVSMNIYGTALYTDTQVRMNIYGTALYTDTQLSMNIYGTALYTDTQLSMNIYGTALYSTFLKVSWL